MQNGISSLTVQYNQLKEFLTFGINCLFGKLRYLRYKRRRSSQWWQADYIWVCVCFHSQVSILSSKRSMNLGIFLKQFKRWVSGSILKVWLFLHNTSPVEQHEMRQTDQSAIWLTYAHRHSRANMSWQVWSVLFYSSNRLPHCGNPCINYWEVLQMYCLRLFGICNRSNRKWGKKNVTLLMTTWKIDNNVEHVSCQRIFYHSNALYLDTRNYFAKLFVQVAACWCQQPNFSKEKSLILYKKVWYYT